MSFIICRNFKSRVCLRIIKNYSRETFDPTTYKDESGLVVTAPKFPDLIKLANVNLLKTQGDYVSAYEPVLELETDKTIVAITAPRCGFIQKFFIANGRLIHSEQPLFEINPLERIENNSINYTEVEFKDQSREDLKASRTIHPIKVTPLQAKFSKMVKDSQNEKVLLTTFNEIDMSPIMKFQKSVQKQFKKEHGLNLTFMAPILKAAVYALERQPIINAFIEGNRLIYRDYIDIKISLATKTALFSQVIKDMSYMSFPEIEQEIQNLLQNLKKKPVDDLDGGTFSIDNKGVVGSLINIPIMTSKQSAVLGINSTIDRPVAMKQNAVIKPMMYVCLTYDHRIVDGREAVFFLKSIKSAVEDPRIIFAQL